ncbi:hypothetical protein N7508_003676 [Penicillium antarcticum]|uniref:uncharacterized protein n=1 Tax=Penicillium antarcticum TaxID=416450 RepID=UPI00238FD115|nr:uncharacterized protein N7508_003676 [Penicillium antarcticum]KAJ5312846.1 hypothetical protein N7508_003676 [Penicillium antarcticum]
MHIKNILLAAFMAISASAISVNPPVNATDITSATQARLKPARSWLQTHCHYGQPSERRYQWCLCRREFHNVISTFTSAVNSESGDLKHDQPTKALADTIQVALFQAYPSLAIIGIDMEDAFIDAAAKFDKDSRNDLQVLLTNLNDENSRFYSPIVKKALPCCFASAQVDHNAIYQTVYNAAVALDPSKVDAYISFN